MSVKRVAAGDIHRCAPKVGEIICVQARRRDRSTAHGHFGADEMRKAKNFEKQIKGEASAPGKPVAASTDTFEQYAELWRAAQRPADPDAVLYPLKRAYSEMGSTRLIEVDGLRLQALQTTLLDKYARNTVEQTMHFVKAVMRQAAADGRVMNDPTTRVRMPRRDSRDRDGVVTADEVPTHAEALAILGAAPTRYRLGVALGLGCGFRVGEVLGLTPAQIDLKAGTVTVDAQQQRRGRVGPKTWRGVRTIEVPDVVLQELRRVLRGNKTPDVPILTGVRGGAPRRDQFYADGWRPALEGAGLAENAYKFHAARHYAVSAMLGRGVPITEVAAYVGDAVETISAVYAHWLRDAPTMAKGALDQALGPVPQKPAAGAAEGAGE